MSNDKDKPSEKPKDTIKPTEMAQTATTTIINQTSNFDGVPEK
jgi:hypothetical protein